MRKLIVCNIMSLDGYFEGPGRNVMALPFDPGFDPYNAELLRAADTVLMGRRMFEQAKGYWPSVADDPAVGLVEREVARRLSEIEKVVVSDRLTSEQTPPWSDARIVKVADAHERVAELKRDRGRDIVVFGSHILWNDLLAAGLVDELHLLIGPAVLGDGTPAFEIPSPVSLDLLESRTLDDSQLVLVRYRIRS